MRNFSDQYTPALVLRDRGGASADRLLPRNNKASIMWMPPEAVAYDLVLRTDASSTSRV